MSSNLQKVAQGASAAACAFGVVGLVAPKPFAAAYGIDASKGETQFLIRLFSSRNLALGAMGLAVTDRTSRRKLNLTSGGLNALDAVIGLTASQVTGNTRMRGPLTSGAFAVLGLLVGIKGE